MKSVISRNLVCSVSMFEALTTLPASIHFGNKAPSNKGIGERNKAPSNEGMWEKNKVLFNWWGENNLTYICLNLYTPFP